MFKLRDKRIRRRWGIGLLMSFVLTLAACTSTLNSSANASDQGGDTGNYATSTTSGVNQNTGPPSEDSGNSADISTKSSNCGVLVWNGDNKSTRGFYTVVRPGKDYSYGDNLDIYIIPGCGNSARNFVIDSGEGLKNPLGEPVDDRHLPSPLGAPAYTAAGGNLPATPVYVELRMDWNLCQSWACFSVFWSSMCEKYTCSGNPTSRDNPYPDNANASSSPDGWNRMLAEWFGGTFDQLIRDDMPGYPATITLNTAEGIKLQHDLATQLSKEFNDAINVMSGSPYQLFCGPGNSHYTNTGSHYFCALPRVRIISIINANNLNFGLYGANARNVATCKAVGPRCNMMLGNNGLVINTKAKREGATQANHAAAA